MKGSTQVIKGRIEEAAGALTGSNRLRARGHIDQAVGHVKQVADKSVRQVRKTGRKIVDEVSTITQRVLDKTKRRK